MSKINVREIKLELRYPNSRQEDITDAFMRGYQGAVKIGNDAIERLKAENKRLRELCERAVNAIDGNCATCPYFGSDCSILIDLKCVAASKIRDELRKLEVAK